MTEQTPQELIADYTHLVPAGATIPPDTPYAWTSLDGKSMRVFTGGPGRAFHVPTTGRFWTKTPIKRPLPTEPPSVIVDVVDRWGKTWDIGFLMDPCTDDPWGVASGSDYAWLSPDDIASWSPARIVRDEAVES